MKVAVRFNKMSSAATLKRPRTPTYDGWVTIQKEERDEKCDSNASIQAWGVTEQSEVLTHLLSHLQERE